MDFAKLPGMALVFSHFVASAVAIVTLLQTDFHLLRRYGAVLTTDDCQRIHRAKPVMTAALWALWITGILICLLGWLRDPAYLLNQKLMMKVLVVEILTLNGLFLHGYAFRFVKPGIVLARQGMRAQFTLAVLGAISSTSWLFACFLGLARPLNNLPNFYDILAFYGLMLGGAILGGWAVTQYLAHRSHGATPSMAPGRS